MSETRKQLIEQKLQQEFSPAYLQVIDQSSLHNVPKGSESHFKVVVVSDRFQNHSLVARHRQIQLVLADEFKQGLHALSIEAFTSAQWHERGQQIQPSPPCLGGSQHSHHSISKKSQS